MNPLGHLAAPGLALSVVLGLIQPDFRRGAPRKARNPNRFESTRVRSVYSRTLRGNTFPLFVFFVSFVVHLGVRVRSLGAADAAFFGIIKSQQYVQTNAAVPVAVAANGFAFNSFVFASTNGAVTNATVDPPGATPARQLRPDASLSSLRFEESFNTQSALDAAYPNGGFTSTYLMTLQTVNDGTRTATLNFTLLGFPLGNPPLLQVTNFAAAQSIDHTADFTLRWNNGGGQSLDILQLVILDAGSNTVYSSPAPFSAGALTGASSSVVIPAHTFPPDSRLTGHLAIARPGLPNTNSYPGAIGVPALLRDTGFPLQTRPAPLPPRLDTASSSSAPFSVRFTGEPNRTYRLQATEDFVVWTSVVTTNSPTGTGEISDPTSGSFGRRFYRIRVGQ